jgi:hypothetical protein
MSSCYTLSAHYELSSTQTQHNTHLWANIPIAFFKNHCHDFFPLFFQHILYHATFLLAYYLIYLLALFIYLLILLGHLGSTYLAEWSFCLLPKHIIKCMLSA